MSQPIINSKLTFENNQNMENKENLSPKSNFEEINEDYSMVPISDQDD